MPRQSDAWQYFSRSPGKRNATCKLCGKTYSMGGGTSNAWHHIKRLHKDQLEIVQNQMHVVPIYDRNSDERKKLDRCLAMFVAEDMQPLQVVEDRGFRKLVHALNPRYELPSRRTLSDVLLPQIHEEVYTKIKEELRNATNVAITTDCWSSTRANSYITVTGHYIFNGTLKSACLETSELNVSHTANNIVERLSEIVTKWELTGHVPGVTTDSGANMVAAIKQMNLRHLPCVAHMLHLVVQDAVAATPQLEEILRHCSNIVTFFKQSNNAYEKLRRFQRSAGVQELCLIQQCPTRWNSKLEMVARLLEVREQLVLAQSELINAPRALQAEEWEILKDVAVILQPVKKMSNLLSSSTYVTCSKIIPLVHGLYLQLQGEKPHTETAKNFQRNILEAVSKRLFQYEAKTLTKGATLLDPRYKKIAFRSSDRAEEARRQVETELRAILARKEATTENLPSTSAASSSIEGEDLLSFLKDKVAQAKSTSNLRADAVILLRQYLEIEPLPITADPIKYWNDIRGNPLSELALGSYLCVPATSVPAEEVFSAAGQILSERRSSLTPRRAEMLIFLHKNASHL